MRSEQNRWCVMYNRDLEDYREYLWSLEKSRNTIDKYVRDVKKFLFFLEGEKIEREKVLNYKEYLKKNYKISSANSMLASLNNYLKFKKKQKFCVRSFRVQRQAFREDSRSLSKTEYQRLLMEAEKRKKIRLSCIMQTIAATGIRVSELPYITVESLNRKMAQIDSKGKTRIVLIPRSLSVLLWHYCKCMKIKSGCIFVTRNGNKIDRRNIWAEMKELCKGANVDSRKIFPHNLRHLFAQCYYKKEKDLVRLADYLGHSSVETTRRYVMLSKMETCLQKLELGLLLTKKIKLTTDLMT